MLLSVAIRQRIINLAIENNVSLHQLSLDAGIPYSTLSSFLNGKSEDPKISTILHICEGLNISLQEFFDESRIVAMSFCEPRS